jgi:hypothetical protein
MDDLNRYHGCHYFGKASDLPFIGLSESDVLAIGTIEQAPGIAGDVGVEEVYGLGRAYAAVLFVLIDRSLF